VRRIETSNPWERRFGYARAVRRGSFVAVSPIAACDERGRALGADALLQARAVFARLARVLAEAGASLGDVVRLRVHYVDPDVSGAFERALKEAFPDGAPALTTVRVTALASPEFLLELEADAVVAEPPRTRASEPVWEVEGD
jgi:enamine deaminase RidA (YjgF/YER057c/UK114 family)